MSIPLDTTRPLIPCGSSFRARSANENVVEKMPKDIRTIECSILALKRLSRALPDEAREALFTDKDGDNELRILKIKQGFELVEAARNAQPDVEWLREAKPQAASDFRSAELHEDSWLKGPEPSL